MEKKMTNQQKLEKLKLIKQELLAVNGYANAEAVHAANLDSADVEAYASELSAARKADLEVRENVAAKINRVNQAIDFIEQQINLEYCLSL